MSNVAAHVIEKCGGHRAVADMAGVDVTRVYRWTYSRDRGGTGGIIPTKHHQQLLRVARERGVDLEPADFFDIAAA